MAVAGLFVIGFAVAGLDWWAVEQRRHDIERFAKPAVMLVLLVIVAIADLGAAVDAARWPFAIAVALSLVGDVALLPRFDNFLAGLGAFLAAHVAYIVGLLSIDRDASWLTWVGVVVVVVAINTVGVRIARNAGSLRVPVWVYITVISGLVVSAAGTGSWLAFAGALLFFASDGLLGWRRFIGAVPGERTAVHVSYHLGQIGLVAWLVSS